VDRLTYDGDGVKTTDGVNAWISTGGCGVDATYGQLCSIVQDGAANDVDLFYINNRSGPIRIESCSDDDFSCGVSGYEIRFVAANGGAVEVEGDLNVSVNADVTGNMQIDGNLTVDGTVSPMTFNGGTDLMSTPGDFTMTGVEQTLTITGIGASTLYFKRDTASQRFVGYTNATEAYPFALGAADTEYLRFDKNSGPSGNVIFTKPFNAVDSAQAGTYVGPIAFELSTGKTATGTACGAGCLTLAKMVNSVSTVAANTCVTLPLSHGASVFAFVHVSNTGANTLLVCPGATGTTTIFGGASTTIGAGAAKTFFDQGTDWSFH
jgi:hypothetical protein